MPIYEYRCQSCGHELEALQKISDDELKECPECDQPELKKLMSAAGFRLKGSGWYETDFKSGNQRNLHEGGDKKDSGDKKNGGDKKGKEAKSTDKKTSKSKTDSKQSSTGKSGKSNKNKPASAA